jgi:hypothetical protein
MASIGVPRDRGVVGDPAGVDQAVERALKLAKDVIGRL